MDQNHTLRVRAKDMRVMGGGVCESAGSAFP